MTYWKSLDGDERAQIVAYDELERDEREERLKSFDKLSTEALLLLIWQNG